VTGWRPPRRPRAPRSGKEAWELAPAVAGRVLDARLHLLDRQVLDLDGTPVTTVDDLELAAVGPAGRDGADALVGRPVVVAALLAGPALVTRIAGGWVPRSRMHRLPWESIAEIDVAVRLAVRGERLTVTWTERWVRERIVRRIPGGTHDPG
jgi:hypothetical protein